MTQSQQIMLTESGDGPGKVKVVHKQHMIFYVISWLLQFTLSTLLSQAKTNMMAFRQKCLAVLDLINILLLINIIYSINKLKQATLEIISLTCRQEQAKQMVLGW